MSGFREYPCTYAYVPKALWTIHGQIRGGRPVENHAVWFVPALGSFRMLKDGETESFFVDRHYVDSFVLELEDTPTADVAESDSTSKQKSRQKKKYK
jgi:hypothetical protein